jgi:hypothetical protein
MRHASWSLLECLGVREGFRNSAWRGNKPRNADALEIHMMIRHRLWTALHGVERQIWTGLGEGAIKKTWVQDGPKGKTEGYAWVYWRRWKTRILAQVRSTVQALRWTTIKSERKWHDVKSCVVLCNIGIWGGEANSGGPDQSRSGREPLQHSRLDLVDKLLRSGMESFRCVAVKLEATGRLSCHGSTVLYVCKCHRQAPGTG